MGKVDIAHYVFMAALFKISIITLAVSGSIIATAFSVIGFIPVGPIVDFAIAVITLVIIVPSAIINFLRRGAFTSLVAVELGWTSVLTIFWVAAAAYTTWEFTGISPSCNYVIDDRGVEVSWVAYNSLCHQGITVEAMTWLGFISLLAWLVTLITLSAISHSRGHFSVWKKSVTSENFSKHAARSEKLNMGNQQYPFTQPMQPQHTGYMQQQYQPYPAVQPMGPPVRYNPSPAPYSNGIAQV